MKKFLGIFLLVLCLVFIPAYFSETAAETPYLKRGSGYANVPGPSGPAESPCQYYYKSQEEVAWDLMMLGLNSIPKFKNRIESYEDLLSAYRLALRTVKQEDKY